MVFLLCSVHRVKYSMTSKGIENVNPQLFTKKTKREITSEEEDELVEDPIDEREIFGKDSSAHLRNTLLNKSTCLIP